MRKPTREVVQVGQSRVPGLVQAGHHASRSVIELGLSPHRHVGAYEVCLIVRGEVDWWVGRDLHHVTAGQLYITRPDELHGGIDGVLHACELYWLEVRLDGGGDGLGLPTREAKHLAQGFARMTRRRFEASAGLAPLFAELIAEHRNASPLATTAARAVLHRLLVGVLRDHDATRVAGRGKSDGLSPAVRRSVRWMHTHLAENFPIEEVADVAGLSVTQFHHRFVTEVGTTPNDWRTRQRIAKARERLRRGDEPVTALAYDLGFSSSQYFATTFKRLVGLTPSAYRSRYAT